MRSVLMLAACLAFVGCTNLTGRLTAIGEKGALEIILPEVPENAPAISLDEPEPPVVAEKSEPEKIEIKFDIPTAKPAEKSSTEDKTAKYIRGGMKDDKPAEFGCDEKNFYWIQGRVTRMHLGREKVWKIRYAPYDKVDPYGGSLVLKGDMPNELKDGDLVRVEGIVPTEQKDAKQPVYKSHRVTILAQAQVKN